MRIMVLQPVAYILNLEGSPQFQDDTDFSFVGFEKPKIGHIHEKGQHPLQKWNACSNFKQCEATEGGIFSVVPLLNPVWPIRSLSPPAVYSNYYYAAFNVICKDEFYISAD